MTAMWSPWAEIHEPAGYTSHAVYQLRFVDASGGPCPISRFLAADLNGILYVGERASMEQARNDILIGIASWNKHMAGIMLHILSRYSQNFQQQHNGFHLQYRFEQHPSQEFRKLREERLIKEYVVLFGEVPPLNSSIPNRHAAWETETSQSDEPVDV